MENVANHEFRWISTVYEQDEIAVKEGVTLVTCVANELLAACDN